MLPMSRPARVVMAAVAAGALVLLSAAGAPAAGVSRARPAKPPPGVPCAPLRGYLPVHHFPAPTKIDNPYFPLVPGTQYVLEGQANRGGGTVAHRVTFTVTDLTKVVGHTTTLVVWDLDEDQGKVVESELAFFAQDDVGNVWSLGEYPEEYEDGQFVGADSTWFARRQGALPGVIVPGDPAAPASRSLFLEGFGPAIDFLDCAKVSGPRDPTRGPRVCTPAGCFEDVLTVDETSPLEPDGGTQVKFYAPGVGNIQIGAVNDPEAETLALTRLVHLGPDGMAAARAQALALERHAYDVSPLYARTPPMTPIGG
jgi:hypothetical protein